MSFPNRNLKQIAIYWGDPVNDGNGQFTYSDPVEISCRWQSGSQVITNSQGVEVIAKTTVLVDQDLDEEGMLLLGELADFDLSVIDDPVEIGASKILRFDKIPTIKATAFFRKAYL